MYDIIIVGSGFCGSTIANLAARKLNKKSLILERRTHIAGNMFDEKNDAGILIHKYGPHILHTNNQEVYDFLTENFQWDKFLLKCRAVIDGKSTPTPFNFETIDTFYTKEKGEELKSRLIEVFKGAPSATVVELMNSEDSMIREYAEFLFEKDYRPYTSKQWGIPPEKIDVSVLKRVPVNISYEEYYFSDKYQMMPNGGYTKFFEQLLDHPHIDVITECEARNRISLNESTGEVLLDNEVLNVPFLYTGAIDELFDYKFGKLPYRSLVFDYQTHQQASFQDAPVVAHPQAKDFTRITEYSKLPVQQVGDVTTIAVEYSKDANESDELQPYYPIPTDESRALYNQYKNLASAYPKLYLCGRLADYMYYNMDQAIARAFHVFNNIQW